jgi:hypothetical protein
MDCDAKGLYIHMVLEFRKATCKGTFITCKAKYAVACGPHALLPFSEDSPCLELIRCPTRHHVWSLSDAQPDIMSGAYQMPNQTSCLVSSMMLLM